MAARGSHTPEVAGSIPASATMVCVVALSILAVTASAHDAARSELSDWYTSLKAVNGAPCCDGMEATHLSDVEWRSNGGHYEVRLKDMWINVPDGAVVRGPNLAGTALVWPFYRDGFPVVRCFMPGAML